VRLERLEKKANAQNGKKGVIQSNEARFAVLFGATQRFFLGTFRGYFSLHF